LANICGMDDMEVVELLNKLVRAGVVNV
jgi:hypothetical protein